jgi:hypothetical protein
MNNNSGGLMNETQSTIKPKEGQSSAPGSTGLGGKEGGSTNGSGSGNGSGTSDWKRATPSGARTLAGRGSSPVYETSGGRIFDTNAPTSNSGSNPSPESPKSGWVSARIPNQNQITNTNLRKPSIKPTTQPPKSQSTGD